MKTIYGFDSDEVRNKWLVKYSIERDSDDFRAQTSALNYFCKGKEYWTELLYIVEQDMLERTRMESRFRRASLGRMKRPVDEPMSDVEQEVADILDYGF